MSDKKWAKNRYLSKDENQLVKIHEKIFRITCKQGNKK